MELALETVQQSTELFKMDTVMWPHPYVLGWHIFAGSFPLTFDHALTYAYVKMHT